MEAVVPVGSWGAGQVAPSPPHPSSHVREVTLPATPIPYAAKSPKLRSNWFNQSGEFIGSAGEEIGGNRSTGKQGVSPCTVECVHFAELFGQNLGGKKGPSHLHSHRCHWEALS